MELFFRSSQQLRFQLQQSLQSCDDNSSRKILDALELALQEGSIIDEEMYTISMIVYLLQSDFYGAKYLWKRAPFSIKTESSEFTRVWEIGKSLIQNLIPNAYQIIKSNQWSENISMLINRLYVYIQNLSVTLIKGAYKTITVSEMMTLLDMDLAQCKEVCQGHNWSFSDSGEYVTISTTGTRNSNQEVSPLELLQTFTQYNAICELASAPLKFDLKPGISRANSENV